MKFHCPWTLLPFLSCSVEFLLLLQRGGMLYYFIIGPLALPLCPVQQYPCWQRQTQQRSPDTSRGTGRERGGPFLPFRIILKQYHSTTWQLYGTTDNIQYSPAWVVGQEAINIIIIPRLLSFAWVWVCVSLCILGLVGIWPNLYCWPIKWELTFRVNFYGPWPKPWPFPRTDKTQNTLCVIMRE